jgi:hypothetical protein
MLSTIKSKILYFSLHIQTLIEKVVNEEDGLLKTSSGVPFLENMCCHIKDNNKALFFFTSREKEIETDNEIIQQLREIYDSVTNISKASVLIDKSDTKVKYPNVSNNFGEKTIYQGFIQFCKMNKEDPVDDSLLTYCMDQTSGFNKLDSLSDKIEIMKGEGKEYDNDMFIELLNAVNKRRVLATDLESIIPKTHEKLTFILQHIKRKEDGETSHVSPSLITLIEKTLKFVGTYKNVMLEDIKKLKNYLLISIKTFKINLKSYISEHSSMNRSDKKKIEEFIDTIESFNDMEGSELITSRENTSISNISFLQNCLYHLTKEFPNIILNKVNYSNIKIHKHWKLSERHTKDIKELLSKNYELLKPFYGNKDLIPLLYEIETMNKDIIRLIENTPITKDNTTGESDVFHIELVKDLYVFYFFSIFDKYTQLEKLALDEEYAVLDEITDADENYADEIIREEQTRQETNIMEGNQVQVQKLLATLMGSYLLIFNRQKKRINMNREDIMELVLRSKEREKDIKTRQLKDLTDEERKVDSELRKAKLGQWNIGLQKGLTQYVKGFYDVERAEMEKEAIIESKLGNITDVTNMNRDIYEMDVVNEHMTDLEAEAEANDMTLLADDDDHGDYDGDEYY